jgi:uncharacterized Ntn-hydrolase superfamily protein
MKKIISFFLAIVFSISFYAQDTFSIVAIDTITGEVGSAGASCVYIAGQGVRILSDVHPGVGVIHTQAYYLSANQNYARNLMNQGLSPQQIIDSLIANDAQGNPTPRQYGIVDFRDGVVRSAAYTGENCDDYKNHITGPNYSIQGNILLGQQILDSMEARFLRADGELACKLMEALQGAKVVGADTRCLPDGISSIGSFLRVAQPGDDEGNLYLDFNIPIAAEGVDPIDSLQSLIDEWGGCVAIGIPEETNGPVVRLFPNPVTHILTIEFDGNYSGKISIINLFGQVVLKEKISKRNNLQLNLSHLPAGIYLYNFRNTSGVIRSSGKFQKQ